MARRDAFCWLLFPAESQNGTTEGRRSTKGSRGLRGSRGSRRIKKEGRNISADQRRELGRTLKLEGVSLLELVKLLNKSLDLLFDASDVFEDGGIDGTVVLMLTIDKDSLLLPALSKRIATAPMELALAEFSHINVVC